MHPETICSDSQSLCEELKRWIPPQCQAASIGPLAGWKADLESLCGCPISDWANCPKDFEKKAGIVFLNSLSHSIRADHQQVKNAGQAENIIETDGILICFVGIEEVFEAWQNVYERFGFSLIRRLIFKFNNNSDSGQVLIFLRSEQRSASQSTLKAVIESDNKKTTYKLALLRAVCEVSVSMPTAADFLSRQENLDLEAKLLQKRKSVAVSEEKREKRASEALTSDEICIPDFIPNRAEIPFGLVLERVLEYYWYLFPNSQIHETVFPPQSIDQRLRFRQQLQALIDRYYGDFESFKKEWYSGDLERNKDELSRKKAKEITSAFRILSETFINGPIQYSGNSAISNSKLKDWLIFSVQRNQQQSVRGCIYSTPEKMIKAEGSLYLPASLWFEISNSSIWLRDSIIIAWAQLSAHFSEKIKVPNSQCFSTADILPRLLPKKSDRDTKIAKNIFDEAIAVSPLHCVWTGRKLKPKAFHVDHLLPWSRLHSNALWNLVPACSAVNENKSDKIPSIECLEKSANRIFIIWSLIDESPYSYVFRREAETTLTGKPLPKTNWKTPLFDRLIETTESIALQSGAPRWEP